MTSPLSDELVLLWRKNIPLSHTDKILIIPGSNTDKNLNCHFFSLKNFSMSATQSNHFPTYSFRLLDPEAVRCRDGKRYKIFP